MNATELAPDLVGQLTEVLRESGRIGATDPVANLRVHAIGTGQMSDTVRCSFTIGEEGTNESVVIKLPASDTATAATARHAGVYDREARFYQELRGEIDGLNCPHYYGTLMVEGVPAIILQDVGDGRQGDQIQGASMAQAQLAVDQLAPMQARWWNDPDLATAEWLQRRAGADP